MTLYEFMTTEFSLDKRQKLVKWGIIPPRLERDVEIYSAWLNIRNTDAKMEVYAELAERFGVCEGIVRRAILILSQELD